MGRPQDTTEQQMTQVMTMAEELPTATPKMTLAEYNKMANKKGIGGATHARKLQYAYFCQLRGHPLELSAKRGIANSENCRSWDTVIQTVARAFKSKPFSMLAWGKRLLLSYCREASQLWNGKEPRHQTTTWRAIRAIFWSLGKTIDLTDEKFNATSRTDKIFKIYWEKIAYTL